MKKITEFAYSIFLLALLTCSPLSAATLNVLYNFSSATTGGTDPFAESLIQASDGNFYGTAEYGGDFNGFGTVFKITPQGVFTSLLTFDNTHGAFPIGGVIQGRDGNFYGTTSGGGSGLGTAGTVFKITPAGTLTTLYNFNFAGINGAWPWAGLVQGSDGN